MNPDEISAAILADDCVLELFIHMLIAAAVGPGPARTALGHRRRRGARGGRPVKLMECKRKEPETRETTKNQNQTGNLHVKVELSPQTDDDPMVDTHPPTRVL